MKKVVPTAAPPAHVPLDAVSLGAAIRAARTAQGITLEDAAGLVNVAKQTLVDLEKGVGTVRIEIALRVASDMGVTVFAVPTAKRHLTQAAIRHIMQSEGGDGDEGHDGAGF